MKLSDKGRTNDGRDVMAVLYNVWQNNEDKSSTCVMATCNRQEMLNLVGTDYDSYYVVAH